jgi:hypothetical protein
MDLDQTSEDLNRPALGLESLSNSFRSQSGRMHSVDISNVHAADSGSEGGQSSSYKLVLMSNGFFLAASVFYLIASISEMQQNQTPVEVENLSLAWAMLCLGALGFVVVGMLDFYNDRHWFSVSLIFAGIFGFVSAILNRSNIKASIVLNFLSVHLFVLEALKWIYSHYSLSRSDKWVKTLWTADFFFLLGAVMDVLLGYAYIVGTEPGDPAAATKTARTDRGELASAFFWVISSLLTLTVTLSVKEKGLGGKDGPVQTELSKAATMA